MSGGKRVGKSCLEIKVIGEIDELNAVLGIVVASLRGVKRPACRQAGAAISLDCFASLAMTIQNIQRDLFKIGAELASLQVSHTFTAKGGIEDRSVRMLEKMIDEFWAQLPELKNFILPGGSLAGAHLHQARAVCRRAERQLVKFGKQLPKFKLRQELNIYLNRLSDFLFVAARWVNFKAGEEEIKI